MAIPVAEIEACRLSHDRLHRTVRGLDDSSCRQPSRLPAWSIGHVVTHLARNADSMVRRLQAVIDGQIVPQYPGGAAGRAAGIEAGSGRSAADLYDDLVTADTAVDELFARAPAHVWDRPFAAGTPKPKPSGHLVFMRWREVETHHVDLGLGYGANDWPADLVERWLPSLLEDLPSRTDQRELMAWCLGRGRAPSLEPWS